MIIFLCVRAVFILFYVIRPKLIFVSFKSWIVGIFISFFRGSLYFRNINFQYGLLQILCFNLSFFFLLCVWKFFSWSGVLYFSGHGELQPLDNVYSIYGLIFYVKDLIQLKFILVCSIRNGSNLIYLIKNYLSQNSLLQNL